ncbi:hypothetical protein RFI_19408 [Reticulomyxa filosa]|uniref:F-box domain-containing protein n=1 Tax=Reticulomyxa filosa TaxID=46433 RepID=X6MVQ6_RETFI|nr:hypothetical protein RFI_19408 [Reticulomyxa filosa]|eukprot:ETO17899.1 hypothetical protein RFI_19408 [Reticulomyxa filosa]
MKKVYSKSEKNLIKSSQGLVSRNVKSERRLKLETDGRGERKTKERQEKKGEARKNNGMTEERMKRRERREQRKKEEEEEKAVVQWLKLPNDALCSILRYFPFEILCSIFSRVSRKFQRLCKKPMSIGHIRMDKKFMQYVLIETRAAEAIKEKAGTVVESPESKEKTNTTALQELMKDKSNVQPKCDKCQLAHSCWYYVCS